MERFERRDSAGDMGLMGCAQIVCVSAQHQTQEIGGGKNNFLGGVTRTTPISADVYIGPELKAHIGVSDGSDQITFGAHAYLVSIR